jgi:hypothetical protein
MKILLVEPPYYTRFPPLGLMKLGSYYRSQGDEIKLVRGNDELNTNFDPDIIEITSLFTYSWAPVHAAIEYYHEKFPQAKITVGGLYASIMPERIKTSYPFVEVHTGLHVEAEKYIPAYDILSTVPKWKDWKSSILFTTRGCIRKCPFCVVPELEGKIRTMITNIEPYIFPGHNEIILWDNNFLASKQWKKTLLQLKKSNLKIDFNQGLDARLMDEEKANLLAELKGRNIRLAYDFKGEKESIDKAVDCLESAGLRRRDIFFYTLFNFYDPKSKKGDTPESFFAIIQDISNMGCVSYPMRFIPIRALEKNSYISPLWTSDQIEKVANARRVIGFGGAFPPYRGLVDKFMNAKNFDEAFGLWRSKDDKILQKTTPSLIACESETYA